MLAAQPVEPDFNFSQGISIKKLNFTGIMGFFL